MAYDTESFTLSKEAVDATAETARRVLGRLSPKPEVFRRVQDGLTLPLMVVTEVQWTDLGVGENVDVGQGFFQQANSGLAVFNCKPFDDSANLISDLGTDDPVLCASRFVSGALFTGQTFLACSASRTGKIDNTTASGGGFQTKYDISLDYVSGADQSTWTGLIYGPRSNAVTACVDIDFAPTLRNDRATRLRTCRVFAKNLPGVAFTNGQRVYVTRMPYGNGFGSLLSGSGFWSGQQWMVVDYDCAVPT